MEGDNKQIKINKLNILHQSSRKTKSDYLDNTNDCLTNAFITIYKSSKWCIQSIYEIFLKSLWQVLLFTKEEKLYYNQNDNNKTINSIDIMSINNSAGDNYLEKISHELPRHMIQKNNQQKYHHHLSKSNSQHSHQKISSKSNMLSNKTRITVRSISNQNLNQTQSNHTSLNEQKHLSNTLGTINSHIVVVPVQSSHCQNMISKNDLFKNHMDIKQSENINLREQLADTLCRRSHEPFTYINHGICCGHCRPFMIPNLPCHHSGHYFPSSIPQQQLNNEREFPQKSKHSNYSDHSLLSPISQQQFNNEREFSQKSEQSNYSDHYLPSPLPQKQLNDKEELSQESKQSSQMSDASETQSTPYSVASSIQSHPTNSPNNEPLSNSTVSYNENNEQNQSILSFPDHDTPQSQESDELINNDSQVKLNAQIIVDDLIQNAQEKYQRIARMSIDQDSQNNTVDTNKQTIKNKSKSVIISNESNKQNLSDDNKLCQELCDKLNLSDPNQIAEIVRILASNAPHILKEQPPNKNIIVNNSNINKDNENTLCSQLLLHPPFKPKRLIHLCPDGSIQVLSAVDDNSNENQIINPQKYHLNYSNSAITPSIRQNHILSNESSLALEYETTATTTVDLKTNFNHMMFTESRSSQQSHAVNEIHFDHLIMENNNSILSLQQKQTLCKYNNLLEQSLPLVNKEECNNDHLKIVSQDDDPIVKINLDLNDEIKEVNNEEDENSLPEIFFKRIIVPEKSINHSTGISNEYMMNKNNEMLHVRHKIHQKSCHNRSRSHTNKKPVNIDR